MSKSDMPLCQLWCLVTGLNLAQVFERFLDQHTLIASTIDCQLSLEYNEPIRKQFRTCKTTCLKECKKRICPCSTPSRIALTESARETVSPPRISALSTLIYTFFLSRARDCTTFSLHDFTDFYVNSVIAHHMKINYHSCFHNHWPNSKMKLKLNIFESMEAPWCYGGPTLLYILRIGRIGSGYLSKRGTFE